jgi:hypothetical protein
MQIIIDTLKDSQADVERVIVFLGGMFNICTVDNKTSAANQAMHPDDVDPDPVKPQGVGASPESLIAIAEAQEILARHNAAPPSADVNPFSTAPVVMPGMVNPSSNAPLPPVAPASPPVAPVAPSAPVSATPPVPGVELDAEGIPWDNRIHAATKTKIKATGNWKVKKGLNDDALLKSVRAELLSLRQLPAPTPPVAPAPASATAPMVAPTAPIATGPRPDPQNSTEFMPRITPALVSGALSQPQLIEVLNQHGIPTLPGLAHVPHLVPVVWAALKQICPTLQ